MSYRQPFRQALRVRHIVAEVVQLGGRERSRLLADAVGTGSESSAQIRGEGLGPLAVPRVASLRPATAPITEAHLDSCCRDRQLSLEL